MLEQLIAPPVPTYLLAAGGVIAILIGLKGGAKDYALGSILTAIGFITGIIMITAGIRMLIGTAHLTIPTGLLILLGVGLFFRVFKKVPVAIIVSLFLATLTFVILGTLTQELNWLLIGVAAVFVISLLIVGSVEAVADAIGTILGWRPILLVLGLISLLAVIGVI